MDDGPRGFRPQSGGADDSKKKRLREEEPRSSPHDGPNKRQKRKSGPRPPLSSPQPIPRIPIPNSSLTVPFETLVPRLREHEEPERQQRLRRWRQRRSLSSSQQPFVFQPPPSWGEDTFVSPQPTLDDPSMIVDEQEVPSSHDDSSMQQRVAEDPSSMGAPPVTLFEFSRHTDNVVRETHDDAYVGFLDRFERVSPVGEDADERWTLTLQCVPETWFDDVWSELRIAGFIPDLFRLSHPTKGTYSEWLRSLPFDDQAFLFCIWFWFVNRLLKPGAEAPITILSLTLDARQLRLLLGIERMSEDRMEDEPPPFSIDEDDWLDRFYNVRFAPGVRCGLVGEAWTVGLSPADDVDPISVMVAPESFNLVPDHQDPQRPMPQSVLRQIHFPRTEPQPPAMGPGHDPPPDDDVVMQFDPTQSSPHGSTQDPFALLLSGAGSVLERLWGVVRGWAEAARRKLDAWGEAIARASAWALVPSPTGAALTSRWRPSVPEPWLTYTGANDGHLAGGTPPANPMMLNTGAHQPFVGVIDVGQGNCNVLFDNQGQALAFYDFGYTVESKNNAPSVDPIPKLSDGPLIILSHWDKDHIYLGRQHPLSFRLNWLAPAQDMGTGEIRETVARIMQEGGHLYVWEAKGGHMTFPWGFVVRGDDPKGGRNNTGLAVYACVRDGTGTVAAPTAGTRCAAVDGATTAANVARYMKGSARDAKLLETDIKTAVALAEMRAIALILNGTPDVDPVFGVALATAYRVATDPISVTRAQIIECARVVHEAFAAEGATNERAIQAAMTAAILSLQQTAAGTAIPSSTVVAAARQAVSEARQGVVDGRPTAASFQVALFGKVDTANHHPNFTQGVANSAADLAVAAVYWDDEDNKKGPRQKSKQPFLRRAEAMANTPEGKLAGVAASLAVTAIGATGARADVVETTVGACDTTTSRRARTIIEQLTVAAPVPGPVVPGLIQATTTNANPPYAADEMFILSTGDVLIQHIPTQRFVPPPLVIGMVAPHHGSIKADGSYLESEHVPWAPNSLPACVVGCAQRGETKDQRIVGSAAVAALGIDRASSAPPRDRTRRAALAALEAVAARDDLETTVAYAAACHVLATTALTDARTIVAAAKALGASCTPGDVLAQAKLRSSPEHDALAAAACSIIEATVTPTDWNDAEIRTAVKAATWAGHAIARKTAPDTKNNRHFNGIEDVVKAVRGSPLSSSNCADALTAAHGGATQDAADEMAFAVGVFAAWAADAAHARHDANDWGRGVLSDQKYPPEERRTTVVAAAVATAAKAAGVADVETEQFARVLVRAALASDALVDAARGAMDVANVSVGAGFIAYPAGLPSNKFGHPNEEAVVIYKAHGYEIEMFTVNKPPTNPAVGWVDGTPGKPLQSPSIDAAAGHGITTFATR